MQYCHIIQQDLQGDYFDVLLPSAVDVAAADELENADVN